MAKGDNLGDFEQLVLTAVILVGKDAYGLKVYDKVSALCGGSRNVSLAAVYTTLDRLDQKGHCKSWQSDPTAERGWKMKRFYEVTALGSKALNASMIVSAKMVDGLREIGQLFGQL